jgi:hypothetical protein
MQQPFQFRFVHATSISSCKMAFIVDVSIFLIRERNSKLKRNNRKRLQFVFSIDGFRIEIETLSFAQVTAFAIIDEFQFQSSSSSSSSSLSLFHRKCRIGTRTANHRVLVRHVIIVGHRTGRRARCRSDCRPRDRRRGADALSGTVRRAEPRPDVAGPAGARAADQERHAQAGGAGQTHRADSRDAAISCCARWC